MIFGLLCCTGLCYAYLQKEMKRPLPPQPRHHHDSEDPTPMKTVSGKSSSEVKSEPVFSSPKVECREVFTVPPITHPSGETNFRLPDITRP